MKMQHSLKRDTADPKTLLTIEVFVLCLKKRFSGVSATIQALLPAQSERAHIAYIGPEIAGSAANTSHQGKQSHRLTLCQAIQISRHTLHDGRKRIWHLRRNKEMLIGIILRDICRLPIHLVFTSAAIRQHSAYPRWLIKRMDKVIATSPKAASFVANTSAIVEHGVDTRRYTPPGEDRTIRDDEKIEHYLFQKQQAWIDSGLTGKYGIGIFGRIREEKGIHLFIEAMLALLPIYTDFTAIIVGLCQSKDRDYARQLQQKIAAAGLEERIIFLGEVDYKDMPQWYRRTLITVACPLYEGYGLTVLEAMAGGNAVIASKTGAFPKIVEQDINGKLIEIDDVSALKCELKMMLESPLLAASMGLNGRQHIIEHYSMEKEVAGIQQVYQNTWSVDGEEKISHR